MTGDYELGVVPPMSSMDITDAVLNEVAVERHHQDCTWGEQNHDIPTFMSILTEEVGEAARAGNDYHFSNPSSVAKPMRLLETREELIQVAAVAVAMVERIDRLYYHRDSQKSLFQEEDIEDSDE